MVEIVVAVIGGVFGLVTPLVMYYVQRRHSTRDLETIPGGRRVALDGVWRGHFQQSGDADSIPIRIVLHTDNLRVRGEASFEYPLLDSKPVPLGFHVNGGFYHDRFLKLEYRRKDEAMIQFGTIMLELSSEAVKMTGKYVGYGSITERIVSGDVTLIKD